MKFGLGSRVTWILGAMVTNFTLLLSYNSSITDIEHSTNYTTFGLPQTHKVK